MELLITSARALRFGAALASLALLASCDPTQSDSLRAGASVFVLRPAGSAPSGQFGMVLRSFDAGADGNFASRFVVAGGVGAGDGSAFFVFQGFETIDGVRRATFERPPAFAGCDMPGECASGHGLAVAGFPTWRSISGSDLHGCVAAPSTTTGQVQIRCATRTTVFESALGPGGEEFGTAMAGIPGSSPLGVAIIGAPGADSGRGALYRLPNGSSPVRLDTSAVMLPPGVRLGSSVEVARLSDRSLLVASFAPGSDIFDMTRRLVVLEVAVDLADAITVTPRACLEGMDTFGEAATFGDLDGDAVPDLIVGYGISSASPQRIHVWSGASLTAAIACGDAQPPETTAIACTDVEEAATPCVDDAGAPIGFGSALTVGDVNGDGANDLIVGAPNATTLGPASGAVFVLANTPGGGILPDRGDLEHHSILTHSGQSGGDHLGTRVVVIRGDGRDEIVASAPEAKEVVIFLCSDVIGDRPADFPGGVRGCLPAGSL